MQPTLQTRIRTNELAEQGADVDEQHGADVRPLLSTNTRVRNFEKQLG